MESKDITDPNYLGPGKWHSMHIEATNANDMESKKVFCKNVRVTCDTFPCKKCVMHCQKYIKNNPPEKFIDVKIEIDGKLECLGLSIWSWTFHNCVNFRLGKPMMDWNTYYAMYIKTESNCTHSCSLVNHEDIQIDKEKIPKAPRKYTSKKVIQPS